MSISAASLPAIQPQQTLFGGQRTRKLTVSEARTLLKDAGFDEARGEEAWLYNRTLRDGQSFRVKVPKPIGRKGQTLDGNTRLSSSASYDMQEAIKQAKRAARTLAFA